METSYRKADVVVAGGGVAGAIAAIASAREGADTLVVEQYGFLGGMFTGGNMYVLNCPPIGGILKEIIDKLMEMECARYCPNDPPNYPIFHYQSESSVHTVLYDGEMGKWVLQQMAEEVGVKIQFHSFITGAVTEGNTVRGINVVNKSGPQIIEGKIIVDATSDGDVAASAGAAFLKGHPDDPEKRLFAMTMLVRLSNVNWAKVSEYSKKDPGLKNAIEKATKKGELPYYRPRTTDMVNYWGHDHPELSHWVTEDGAILWGGTVEGVNGTNVYDLTCAEIEVRKQYMSEINFLKKYVPGFENLRIESSGVNIGVRDTRHIIGEYTVTGKDFLERRAFSDAVGYNLPWVNWLPYRMLVPKTIDNLLLCGNCVSTIPGSTYMGSHLGSYNNMKDIPSMSTTGEAAGVAAALCVKTGVTPRKLDIKLLQRTLRKRGAIVGSDVIRAYLDKKLPSEITVEEANEESRKATIERWKKLGQL